MTASKTINAFRSCFRRTSLLYST